jgi:hypothetical protein
VLPLLAIEPLRPPRGPGSETLAVPLAGTRAAHGSASAAALIAISALTGLADRELGQRTFFREAVRAWKRRADEGAAHRPFIARRGIPGGRIGGWKRGHVRRDVRGHRRGRGGDPGVLLVAHSRQNLVVKRIRGIFAAAPRRAAALERMLGIARRASRLTNFVLDHRDDGVVRHTPLARTVVVDGITDPQPALLHETPGTDLLVGERN